MNKPKSKETPSVKSVIELVQPTAPELSLKEKNRKLKEHFTLVQQTIASMNAYSRMIRLQRNAYDQLMDSPDWHTLHAACQRLHKTLRAS